MTGIHPSSEHRAEPLGDASVTRRRTKAQRALSPRTVPRHAHRTSALADVGPAFLGPRAILYLVALILAEIVTVLVDTRWGVIGHAVILVFLITQSGINVFPVGHISPSRPRSIERLRANFLVCLALVPLIRIVSLSMPLTRFPEWSWYGVIAVPLLAATWAAARACGYTRQEVGLSQGRTPAALLITAAVGASGVVLGYIEFRILSPESLVTDLSPVQVGVVSLTLLVGTGLTEELIFRGVLLVAGSELFGSMTGIVYSAATFSLLHIGHRSALNVGYVFVVGVVFGVIARSTRSVIGVTIAHGLTNTCLLVLFPHLLGG
jgi:CAAX protease family protein